MSIKRYIINERIKAKEVRLIDNEGGQVGVVPIDKALGLAKEKELDLILITETANPPVCKLVDYGQFMYKQRKKEKQARRTAQVIKELKLSPKISDHDYNVRLTRGIKFLQKKYKVKVSVFFRGREIVHQDLGIKVAERFITDIKEYGSAESELTRTGRTIVAIITPK